MTDKPVDKAECNNLSPLLATLGTALDGYLRFEHDDAMVRASEWQQQLGGDLPQQGSGADEVMQLICEQLIPNGSQIPNPACSSFITTGATSIAAATGLAAAVASPQRLGLTAFQFVEELSLDWMVQMFGLPENMKGIYCSGGSVANLVALGAARQYSFERQGLDPSRDGVSRAGNIYATRACHHTIHRSAAVLGLGRNSVVLIEEDAQGRMKPSALRQQLEQDRNSDAIAVAVVANSGSTSTGTIDPLRAIGEIAREFGIWFHVDGAYGLPGILDPQVAPLYDGLKLADSVNVDPHKWLGAPVGIGAAFVRDREILRRAFTQGASDYLEGSFADSDFHHSMDSQGIPYYDFGVEMSSPARGAVVWALLKEIGVEGLRERVCRHNAMARWLSEQATAHPELELLLEPTLSICCFRYIGNGSCDSNALNQAVHRQMVRKGRSMPSTAQVDGKFCIRPCFIGARAEFQHAEILLEEVLATGREIQSQMNQTAGNREQPDETLR